MLRGITFEVNVKDRFWMKHRIFKTKNSWKLVPLKSAGGSLLSIATTRGLCQFQDDLHKISYRLQLRACGTGLSFPNVPFSVTHSFPLSLREFPVHCRSAISIKRLEGSGAIIQLGACFGLGYDFQLVLFGVRHKKLINTAVDYLQTKKDHRGLFNFFPAYSFFGGGVYGFSMPSFSAYVGRWDLTL